MKLTDQYKKGPPEKNLEYLTDKCWPHTYGSEVYDEMFEPIQDTVRNYLEIGAAYGGSALLMRDYFKHATIWTVDIIPPNHRLRNADRIINLTADAYQSKIANMFSSEMDIIIDDGSHNIEDQQKVIDLYLNKLLPGGIFIIEDVESPELSFKLFDKKVENITSNLQSRDNKWINYEVSTYIGPPYFSNIKKGREEFAKEEIKLHGELKKQSRNNNLYIIKRTA